MTRNTRRGLLALGIALALAIPTAVVAALLGVTPSHPVIQVASGNTVLSGGTLTITAAPIAIQTAPATLPRFINPVPGGIETAIIEVTVDGSCNLTGGAGGSDLLVIGEVDLGGGDIRSGTLLTGEVLALGSAGAPPTGVFDFRFEVTGGLLSDLYVNDDIGVVITSENSNFAGDCSVSSAGEAKGSIGSIPPILPAEGCTPGYWKQAHHFDSWVNFAPTDSADAVLGRPVGGTLLDALEAKGGGLNALLRHTVAALLNADSGDVNQVAFPTTADVIAAFQAAYDSGDYEPTKDLFEEANEEGCPLN